jgi:very-short-patch-repair endonuclease
VKEAHLLRLFRQWGLPAPECQYVIRDVNGRFLARVDFAWPRWLVGLEYDGDESHPPRAWAADDRRQGRIEDTGWRLERADRFDVRPSATRLRALLTSVLREPA